MISAINTSSSIWATYAQSAAGQAQSKTDATEETQKPEGNRPPPPRGGSGGVQGMEPSQETETALTEEDLDTISSILEDYDADNISDTDAANIVSSLSDASISESTELANAMKEAGFDANEIGLKAQVRSQQPAMSPIQMQQMNLGQTSDQSTSLEDLLEATETDEDTKNEFYKSLLSKYMDINQIAQTTSMNVAINVLA